MKMKEREKLRQQLEDEYGRSTQEAHEQVAKLIISEKLEQKNKIEELPDSFIEFKDLIKEKKKRGRPLGSFKKCNISSER